MRAVCYGRASRRPPDQGAENSGRKPSRVAEPKRSITYGGSVKRVRPGGFLASILVSEHQDVRRRAVARQHRLAVDQHDQHRHGSEQAFPTGHTAGHS
jgi:hypothetical protein